MSRIYISGKITGLEKSEYMKKFAKAQLELISCGYSVINPAAVNSMLPEDTTYEEYMRMSMTMLEMCDGIYMLDNWKDSPGACREHAVAKLKGKKIIYEDGQDPMAYKDMGQPEKCRFYHDSICCYPIDDEPNCPNYPGNEYMQTMYGISSCSIE